jgi:yeast amino acid transporter
MGNMSGQHIEMVDSAVAPTPSGKTDKSDDSMKRTIGPGALWLVALSGSIGAGLFVGSGGALSSGGPGALVLAFMLIGTCVACAICALGEMATSYPVKGAFYDYGVRFIGRPFGFTVGWAFVLNWSIILPFEIVTIITQLKLWWPDPHVAAQFGVIMALLTGLISVAVFWGAKGFGRVEQVLGVCKCVAISVFICLSLAITISGMPGDPRGAVGTSNWRHPAAFKNGAQGVFVALKVAGMAYGGTETIGLTAAECKRPHKALPQATYLVLVRILLFYGLALAMLGFVVSSDDKELSSNGHGAKASPFVLAAKVANLSGMAHFFMGMIIISLLAMANTAIFSSSRALQAISSKNMGPAVFAKLTETSKTPRNAIYFAFGIGFLALISLVPGGEQAFDWLLAFASVNNYVTWIAICASQIRMRRAMIRRGRNPQLDLIWASPLREWGSYFGITVALFGLLTLVINAFWPLDGIVRADAVMRDLLGIFVNLGMFCGYLLARWIKGWNQPILVSLDSVDLVTGLRSKDAVLEADQRESGNSSAC